MSPCRRTCRKAISSTSAMPAPTPRPTRASSTASRCPKCACSNLRPRFVQDEGELRPVFRNVILPLGFLPAGAVIVREPGVAGVILRDLGHHQPGGDRQRLLEKLLT